MTREEAREAIKEAYGNSEYTDEIIKTLEQESCDIYTEGYFKGYEDGLNRKLEPKCCDRLEYGTDGNVYKLTMTNGEEYKQ